MSIPFMLGCNYWASNAGTEMWRVFDEQVIEEDFIALRENGCDTLRIFPNWRDFQPVMTIDGYAGQAGEYRMNDGSADGTLLPNRYGLDPVMLERLALVCDLAEKHGLRLIVSLITGWMSGRLFVPEMLKGKNVITDPEALRWEHRFAYGVVAYLRNKPAILCWDLGNECNCMGWTESAHQSYVWTMTISSAIRMADATRPILSGMHSLSVAGEGKWSLRDMGELTDIMTNHPYPGSPTIGADVSPCESYRSVMLPIAQMDLYASISGRPSMIEEMGTLNNIYADRETAGQVAQIEMQLAWANGGTGYLWWCAHEQKHLDFAPYSLSMRELGWLDVKRNPKPVARAFAAFQCILDAYGHQPLTERERVTDAVCIMTRDQDVWQVGSMTYLLGKQSGIEMCFAYHDQPIPQAHIYLLPCISGWTTMYKRTYHELLRRVHEEGASLYVSWNGGAIELFEEVFGIQSRGVYVSQSQEEAVIAERRLIFSSQKQNLHIRNVSACVLGRKADEEPVFTRTQYGRGNVYFLSFALEQMLWKLPTVFDEDNPYRVIYKELLLNSGIVHPLSTENPKVSVTRFKDCTHCFVNCTTDSQPLMLSIDPGFSIEEGTELPEVISPCQMLVLKAVNK